MIKIYNKNQSFPYAEIRVENNDIVFFHHEQSLKYHFSQHENISTEIKLIHQKARHVVSTHDLTCNTNAYAVLSLILNKYYQYIESPDGELYDLTFGYAFPLFHKNKIHEYIFSDISVYTKHKLLVYQQRKALTSYVVAGRQEALTDFFIHNKRRWKKCSDIWVKRDENVEHIFTQWFSFYQDRFDRTYLEEEIKAFSSAVCCNSADTYLNKFYLGHRLVAANLVFHDRKERVFYDILAPWDTKLSSYGLGIYTIMFTVRQAFENNSDYSLCYGRIPYKMQLMNPFFKEKYNQQSRELPLKDYE